MLLKSDVSRASEIAIFTCPDKILHAMAVGRVVKRLRIQGQQSINLHFSHVIVLILFTPIRLVIAFDSLALGTTGKQIRDVIMKDYDYGTLDNPILALLPDVLLCFNACRANL